MASGAKPSEVIKVAAEAMLRFQVAA